MQKLEKQFHIHCVPGDVGRYCILPGDPGRVPAIAALFDDAHQVAYNREFNVWTGTLLGEKVTACSTGIIFLGVYGFMGTFLAEKCGLASTQAGLLMMFYGLACLTGGSVSGRIGTARGSCGVIAVGETSGIAACALLCTSALTGSWIAALGAAACLGFGYILVQPTLVTLSMDIDPRHSGLCTGLIGLGVFAGGGVGSVVGGALIGTGGYLTLWIAAGLALAAQALFASKALPRG